MKKSVSLIRNGLVLLALVVSSILLPTRTSASLGDCGQPVSTADGPGAADSLAILQEAVGRDTACDTEPCICDVNDSGDISAIDALVTLKAAVGQDVELACSCPSTFWGCSSVEITIAPGSTLDRGWNGMGHDETLAVGFQFGLDIVSRCSNDNSICERNSDCPGAGSCDPTCDCVSDSTCELAGPVGQKRCRTSLTACSTNADCSIADSCASPFSPPQPVSAAGTPICITPFFEAPLRGTADLATGEVSLEGLTLRWRQSIGIDLAQPCPRCGRPDQDPSIGDQFTCEGGPAWGAACTVDGVNPSFGGVSYDCRASSATSGSGEVVRFTTLTTGTATRTAQLPCSDFSFQSHPSRGNGRCIDNLGEGTCTLGPDEGEPCDGAEDCGSPGYCNAPCSTNADCTRCSEEPTTACASNGDCAGKGTCAEAPDQPVTCGFWCHAGFCDNDPNLPCLQNGDCSDGKTCVVGEPATGSDRNQPQKQPNDCFGALNRFVCGLEEAEKCADAFSGSCSGQPYRACADDVVCQAFGAGTCVIEPRSCFEPRITRTGEPSPLGKYCELERKSCNTNADCAGAADSCVDDAAIPETVALFAAPATSSAPMNSSVGITGPGAIRLNNLLEVCRCGDSEVGCNEECDDGNRSPGDGCDERCRVE